MSRGLLVAVAFSLAFGATAAPRTGEPAARAKTLAKVRGSVDALAQDGRRIAWINTKASCGKQVQILTLPGRRPVYVGSSRGGSCRLRGQTFGAIALTALNRSESRKLRQVPVGNKVRRLLRLYGGDEFLG